MAVKARINFRQRVTLEAIASVKRARTNKDKAGVERANPLLLKNLAVPMR